MNISIGPRLRRLEMAGSAVTSASGPVSFIMCLGRPKLANGRRGGTSSKEGIRATTFAAVTAVGLGLEHA